MLPHTLSGVQPHVSNGLSAVRNLDQLVCPRCPEAALALDEILPSCLARRILPKGLQMKAGRGVVLIGFVLRFVALLDKYFDGLDPLNFVHGRPPSSAGWLSTRDKDMCPSNTHLLVILVIDIGRIGSAPEKLFRSVARWLVMEPRGRGAFGIMVHAALPLLVPSSHHRFQAARFWLRAE